MQDIRTQRPTDIAWNHGASCFACGAANPSGLGLVLALKDGRIGTEFTPDGSHEGYAGVVHGGILGLILDEILIQLPQRLLDAPVATLELAVRYRRAARVGQRLLFSAWMDGGLDSRILTARGEARTEDGTLVASAQAQCIKIRDVVKV